jgi:lipid-A-disaccharide synthase
MYSSLRFMIVAGEASGDLHGAHLVRALTKCFPEVTLSGVGGAHLRAAGVELLSSSDELGVVGISEVVKKLGTVVSVFRRLTRFLKEQQPDLLILIDYPEFNLLLARVAHKLGIPIVYYISPQVWAWRSGRVKLIRKLVTKMIVIFPFEQAFYQQHGVDVAWVGHPLVETVQATLTKEDFCQQHGLDPARPMLGLLPGSRESEVQRLLPVMLATAERLRQQHPNTQFVLPIAPSLHASSALTQLPAYIHATREQTYDTINAADLIVTASGTVTVETALLETPMIITYVVSPLTYWLGKRFIKVPFIGMVNLIAGTQVAPELIQATATPERIAAEVERVLYDPDRLAAMRQALRQVREKLGQPGAADRAAGIIQTIVKTASDSAISGMSP